MQRSVLMPQGQYIHASQQQGLGKKDKQVPILSSMQSTTNLSSPAALQQPCIASQAKSSQGDSMVTAGMASKT